MNPWIVVGIVAACLLALFCIALLLYYFALPRFILHKMRTSDNPDGEMTYPENFDAWKAETELIAGRSYPSRYPSNGYNLYLPKRRDSVLPLIVWVHGGGFIGGSKDGGDNVMVALCAAGYAVASIDYAVAPEYKYPTAIRQISEFVAHLPGMLKEYPCIDGERIVFGGDSAGAQLAAQYTAAQTNPAFAKELDIPVVLQGKIKSALLVCGPFHLPALRAYAKKTNKNFRRLVDMWGRLYFGKFRWYTSKAASETIICEHVSRDFPPTFLTDGNKGSFEAQNRKLAAALNKLGVPTEELYFPAENGDVPHEYLFHLHEENSLTAMKKMISFLNRHVS